MTFTASHLNIRVLLSLLAQNEQTSSYSLLDYYVSVIPTELQGFSSDGNNLVTEWPTQRTCQAWVWDACPAR